MIHAGKFPGVYSFTFIHSMSQMGNAPEKGKNSLVNWALVLGLFACLAALSSVSLANHEVAAAFRTSMGE